MPFHGLGLELPYAALLGKAGTSVPSFDIFVDSVNGNDANTGVSAAQAFKNLTAIPTITSGKRIGLAKGSTWNSGNNKISAGLSGGVANVSVGTYGSGAKPIIDCGDIITAGNWTKTPALTSVYNSPTVTFPAGNGGTTVNTWINIIEDGVFLQYVASQALCDSTAGSYTIADMSVNSGVIYIHSTSGIPTTNGKVYKYSARPWAIKIVGTAAAGNRVDGIIVSLNGEHDGSIVLGGDGSAPTLTNCDINLGGKHSAFMTPGGMCSGNTFTDHYFGNNGSSNMLVYFEGTGSGLGINVSNLTFNYGVNTPGQANSSMIGSHCNSGTLGTFISSNLRGIFTSTVNTNNTGIGPSNVSSITDTNSVLQGLQEGVGMDDLGGVCTLNGTQHVSTVSQNHFIAPGNGWTVNTNATLACVANVQTALFRTNNKTPVVLNMTNDAWFFQPTQGAAFWEFVACTSAERLTVTMNGVTLQSAKAGPYFIDLGTNVANTFTGNNNHYVGASPKWYWKGTTYTSLATWQAAVVQDAASDTTGDASGSCTLH